MAPLFHSTSNKKKTNTRQCELLRAPQRAPPNGLREAENSGGGDFKIRWSVRMLLSIYTVRAYDDPILAVRLYRVTVNPAMEGEDGWSMASDLGRSASSRRTKK